MYKIIIILLIFFINFLPVIITILYPNFCYGCTYIGKLNQEYNNKYSLNINLWNLYSIIILYYIYKCFNIQDNIKYCYIFLLLLLIYLPIFPVINIINIILSLYYNNPPFIHDYQSKYSFLNTLDNNANSIINEFKDYNQTIDCIRYTNPGFTIENSTNKDNCWRSLYLKKKGIINKDMIKYFPYTTNLLKHKQIHNAFFSILDPNVEITTHRGYYKGYLPYHLGIIIPCNDNNEKAYIICGNEKYVWTEKKGIVFDDLYLHYVKNPTNKTRVVLYLDVIRNSDNLFIDFINKFGINFIENSILLNVLLKNQHKQLETFCDIDNIKK